jgi:hypothetical protein
MHTNVPEEPVASNFKVSWYHTQSVCGVTTQKTEKSELSSLWKTHSSHVTQGMSWHWRTIDIRNGDRTRGYVKCFQLVYDRVRWRYSTQCRGQEWVGAIFPLPPGACMAVAGQFYFLYFYGGGIIPATAPSAWDLYYTAWLFSLNR